MENEEDVKQNKKKQKERERGEGRGGKTKQQKKVFCLTQKQKGNHKETRKQRKENV